MNRRLAGARMRLRRIPRAAWAIALLAFVNGAVWAAVVPAWQAPDEIGHFAYVQRFAETGTPQDTGGPKLLWSKENQDALEAVYNDSVKANPRARPPWTQAARGNYDELLRRTHPRRDDGGGVGTTNVYTPVYYATASAGYWLFGWGSIWDRVWGTRLVSAFYGALTVLLVWLFAREVFRREDWLTNTAALSVAFLPQFGFMSGVVNNDSMVIMLGALELYLLARAIRRGLTPKLALGIGATLALGYLVKPTMVAFAPAVAGVLLWPLVRRRRLPAARFAAIAFAGFLVVTAVWAGAAAAYGRDLVPTNLNSAQPFVLKDFVSYLWQFYIPWHPWLVHSWFPTIPVPLYSTWMHSFFAAFGWSDTLFPDWVYRTIAWMCAAGTAVLAVAAWRFRERLRPLVGIAAVSGVTIVVLLLLTHYASYRYWSGYPQEQGRYLLPLAPIFGTSVAAATLAGGRRFAPVIATTLVSGLALFTGFSWGLTLLRYFA